MPVDTKASEYQWYMDVAEAARIVRWVWKPGSGTIVSSMTPGTLDIEQREVDGEEWTSIKHLPDVIWVIAQNMARSEGFTVEVGIYG